MELRTVDLQDPTSALPLAGVVLAFIAVALPWFELSVSPGAGATTGYESPYGIIVIVWALVALLVTFLDVEVTDKTALVTLLSGVAIVLISLARLLTLGDGLVPRGGVYLAIVAGVLVAAGGGLETYRSTKRA